MQQEQKNNKHKIALLAFALAVLSLPALQHFFRLVPEKPLENVSEAEVPPFDAATFFEGTWQPGFEWNLNERLGFHPTLVRLRNQVWYSFMHASPWKEAVVGKDEQLYLEEYINAYTGKDFVGREAVAAMTAKIRALQDTLAAHNVTLLVVFAPGKASVYPEYIPESFGKPGTETNYRVMRAMFDSAKINLVDFNGYFAKQRDKLPYPVYPKVGVHWSDYAALQAMDSIVRYIEHARKVDLPNVVYKGEEWSDQPRNFDNDVGGGLNLLFPVKNYRMAYPIFEIENREGKAPLSVMTISDSYIRMILTKGWDTKVASKHDFWYYNQTVEHSDGRPKNSTFDEDIAKETLNHDVVMIMAAELNLAALSWGFIHDAHRAIVLKQPIPEAEKELRRLENDIRMDKKWLAQIQQKAQFKNVPLDSMIRADALYIISQRKK